PARPRAIDLTGDESDLGAVREPDAQRAAREDALGDPANQRAIPMEADRLAEHRAPAAPARNDPAHAFAIRPLVDVTEVVENGSQQRFALQLMAQFEGQGGAAVGHVLT